MTPESILSDPSASSWLKSALLSALNRDPVDALNDAEILREALQAKLDAALAEARTAELNHQLNHAMTRHFSQTPFPSHETR
jgi:hypothetical protein